MLKHIVFFKLNDTSEYPIMHQLKDKLDALKNKIEQVQFLETGLNISTSKAAYDLALVTEFNTETDLDVYRVHPEHQKVIEFVKEHNIETCVVDYNL